MSFDFSTLGNIFGSPITGAIGSVLGGLFSSNAQSDAASQAAQARTEAINKGLAFQQQQFGNALGQQQGQFNTNLGLQQQAFGTNLGLQQGLLDQALSQGGGQSQQQLAQLQSLFAPLQSAGAQGFAGLGQFAQSGLGGYQNALQGQQALAGALGNDAQSQAIAGIQNGPLFSGLAKQGEDAILQNASATGGLRGGNVQAALAQFRPQLLNQLIQQQFSNLGGIAGLGAQGAQGFGALSQLGQAGASGLAQGNLGVLQGQLGLLGNLTGSAAGNIAGASNALAGNIAGASNQFANNAGNLSSSFGNGITDLLGQLGAVGAGNALAQGQASSNFWNTAGNALNQQSLLRLLSQRPGMQLSNDPQTAIGQMKAGF